MHHRLYEERLTWIQESSLSPPYTSRPPPPHLSYMLSYYFFSIYYWAIRMELGFLSVFTFYILHSFLTYSSLFCPHFSSYLCSIIIQACDNIRGEPTFSYKMVGFISSVLLNSQFCTVICKHRFIRQFIYLFNGKRNQKLCLLRLFNSSAPFYHHVLSLASIT